MSVVRFNDTDLDIMVQIFRSVRLLDSMMEKGISEFNIPLAQFNVMGFIYYSEHPMTVTEIAEKSLVSKANVTGLVKRLESAKLVKKTHDENDARIRYIHLTAKGMKLIEKVLPRYFDITKDAMSIFSDRDKKKFLGFLDHIEGFLRVKYESERRGK
ncbi:MarR family transcriptional regulator [Halobacteriovorax sp. GB3]|uniref:MarR family winged helix-turn-helix transcriptional regulator n=1 Tax=Halobacteriovorax sp. GB3 TaxID=2719615 RepID=UPI0023619FC7|nr:MarR family transcriptional regulator [Halobacteriovorax sp. GB3]MDD0851527.1 MarR family transcriptional regulator [Halobacteriovorax sp. GB3]